MAAIVPWNCFAEFSSIARGLLAYFTFGSTLILITPIAFYGVLVSLSFRFSFARGLKSFCSRRRTHLWNLFFEGSFEVVKALGCYPLNLRGFIQTIALKLGGV
jgi:hypothetical protein